jgi:hypothetical protein
LEAVFYLFAYLRKKQNGVIVLDPTYPDIDLRQFNDGVDWKNIYGDIKEAIPPDAPEPRGKTLITRLFVDSDHAGDVLIRQSRTGFIIYLNNAPVIWYSKRQGTVETSVFGAELVAMKVGMMAVATLFKNYSLDNSKTIRQTKYMIVRTSFINTGSFISPFLNYCISQLLHASSQSWDRVP